MEQNKNPLEIRKKIISLIRIKGPCLPIHISREIGIETLFSGAFLSELAREKEIRISNLKVGGSPLYYLPGQEYQLEKFSNYLPGKEKEAFVTLKQKKILEDNKLEPAIRVALRNIKDFAVPLVIENSLFWKFHSINEQEAKSMLPRIEVKRQIIEKKEIKPQVIEKPEIKITREKEKPLITLKETKEKKVKELPDFAKKILSLLNLGNIEILEEKEAKKKEFSSIIRINSDLGKLKFLCIAKDKKSITENDLRLALQKSQTEKMPCLFLAPGELNKKASSYLEEHSSLIKFKKLEQ